jgi:Mg2+-importing ATPase
LKVITGDNRLVAASIGQQVGLMTANILTGSDLHTINDVALVRQVNNVEIFAEIEPNQKEHLIHVLRKAGNVVGYMGDGINDAPALHTADVGISVESAVDVAKDAADIVLLTKDLSVLVLGVREGRRTREIGKTAVFLSSDVSSFITGVELFVDGGMAQIG